jgi:succinylarginine dihydrolase
MITEINFDGLVGPSHNFAGLSLGNLASATHAGSISHPRAAALQGLAKMRFMHNLGLPQGLLLPLERPDVAFLRAMGFAGADDAVCAAAAAADPALLAAACSASAMWTANAATISPAPDTGDARCHISVANLSRMAHRSIEAPATFAQLRVAFADPGFAVHPPLPAAFGDEGAANHMRLCAHHGAPGLEIFVHGADGGRFPARQHVRAGHAIARRHGLARALFIQQHSAAIDAGAFHNDVVAVANGPVLFAHEQAFASDIRAELATAMPQAQLIEVPASAVSLSDAIASYLFNSQLVTLADGAMALILPTEARDTPAVKAWLDQLLATNTPIRHCHFLDVRESMKNGGGPACLRLRVVANPARVDPRFILDDARIDRLEALFDQWWPPVIAPADLANPALWQQCRAARAALLAALGLDRAGL